MPRTTQAGSRIVRPSQVYRQELGAGPRGRAARASDVLLIAGFLAGIWLPLLGMAFGLDAGFALRENRRRAEAPSWPRDLGALSAFPRRFEDSFNDRFGFRPRLIRWLSRLQVEGLGVSSSSQVVLGRDGWLFYAGLGALDYYRATQPFRPDQLDRWARMFQERHDWLAARGIRYLVVIPPNKDTIYPEFMPAALNRVRRRSRLDQLLDYLAAHATVKVVDMRAAFLREKAAGTLYYRTDTHWNDRGAYLGYRAIVEALSGWFPALEPIPPSAFETVSQRCAGLDLAGMLGLPDRFLDDAPGLVPRVPATFRRLPLECQMPGRVRAFQRPFATECDDARLPRAVMLHDSFNLALVPYLPRHFRRIAFAGKYTLDQGLIERERPDVVIQEMVERVLMWNIPNFRDDPPPFTRVWAVDGAQSPDPR